LEIKNFEEAIKPAELSRIDEKNLKSTGIPVSLFEIECEWYSFP
jgi:hypothetical protein